MRTTFFSLTLLLLTAGCGGVEDQKPTVPVEGTVAVNGQPLVGARVAFWTEGAPKAATGITDAEGKFQLSMYSLNDGAMVGTHKITVTKEDLDSAANTAGSDPLSDPSAMTDMYNKSMDSAKDDKDAEVPSIYSDRNKTPLSETVTEEGPNTFVLQIQK